ncbi:MAG: hypothetical protein Kow0089_01170 [Desulfobulbaceae bacterium]
MPYRTFGTKYCNEVIGMYRDRELCKKIWVVGLKKDGHGLKHYLE